MYRFLKLVTTSQANAVTKTYTTPKDQTLLNQYKISYYFFKMSTALNVTVVVF